MLDLDEYFAICKHSHALGLRVLSVINGTKVATSSMAARMLIDGPDEMSVSLDSHLENDHDWMRGIVGSYKQAVNAIRLLLTERSRLVSNTAFGHRFEHKKINAMLLVQEGNYRTLDASYDFALNDLKVDKLKINLIQPTFGIAPGQDNHFIDNSAMNPITLRAILERCDKKFNLGLNPRWLEHVEMYARSINDSPVSRLNWSMTTGAPLCDAYERNLVVSLDGVVRLCFSTEFPGAVLEQPGDLKLFWDSADSIRASMAACRSPCGISHSNRRQSASLASQLAKAVQS